MAVVGMLRIIQLPTLNLQSFMPAIHQRGLRVTKKPTNSMVGNRICFYGRHSNDRVCGIEVTGVNKKGRVDGKRIGNLAMTDSDPGSEHGYSGGPWFSGYTAYGIHVGASGGIAVFMPIEEVEDALDVTLLLD